MTTRGQFNQIQREALLTPVQPFRVFEQDGHSHLAAWDVIAHLNRVFGFEGWDKEVLSLEPVYEHVGQREVTKRKRGEEYREKVPACSVGYRCTMRLTVRDAEGNVVRQIEDAAMGTATNQRDLGDAHDLALKSAVSYALKRCAKDLGDQFGLSLYNKGQETAVVQRVYPYTAESATGGDFEVNVEADGIAEGDAGFGDKRGDRSEPAAAPAERPDPEVERAYEDAAKPDAEPEPEPVREPEPAKPKRQAKPKPEATPPPEKTERPEIPQERLQDWLAEITEATIVHGDTPEGEPRSAQAIWKDIQQHGALDNEAADPATGETTTLREALVQRVNTIQHEADEKKAEGDAA